MSILNSGDSSRTHMLRPEHIKLHTPQYFSIKKSLDPSPKESRQKDEIADTKITGTDNDADYFTKVHPRPKHLEFEERLLKRLPR